MTNVSGTPKTPDAIAVRDPGSITSGRKGQGAPEAKIRTEGEVPDRRGTELGTCEGNDLCPLALLNVERARVVGYRYGCSRWSRFSSLSGRSVNSSTHSDRLPVAELLHVLMLPDLFFNFHPTC